MEKLFDRRLLVRVADGGVDDDLTTSLDRLIVGRRKKDGKRMMDIEGLSATGGGRGGESPAARVGGRSSVERGGEWGSSEVDSLGRDECGREKFGERGVRGGARP